MIVVSHHRSFSVFIPKLLLSLSTKWISSAFPNSHVFAMNLRVTENQYPESTCLISSPTLAQSNRVSICWTRVSSVLQNKSKVYPCACYLLFILLSFAHLLSGLYRTSFGMYSSTELNESILSRLALNILDIALPLLLHSKIIIFYSLFISFLYSLAAQPTIRY